jgi:predicted transcriptional regulator
LTLNIFVFLVRTISQLMPRLTLPRPTDGELAILRVLWRRGPSTVREVPEEISKSQETGYTTVLKMMQIMTEKGLLARDDEDRTHIYQPRLAVEETQRSPRFAGTRQRLSQNSSSVLQKATSENSQKSGSCLMKSKEKTMNAPNELPSTRWCRRLDTHPFPLARLGDRIGRRGAIRAEAAFRTSAVRCWLCRARSHARCVRGYLRHPGR